jgi:predicted ATPase/DNA-binding CsgD family transcriptional regulator/transcriptional regulator with XRE-family HTH domain
VLEFARLLRQLRARAGLTQEELAEASGLSPRSVSDLERGINRTARKDTAVLLAGALGLAEPVRGLFVAAARGRGPAAEVLAAGRRLARDAPTATGGLHGFPATLTSFVGRAAPVREVEGLLAEYRLVTVTGPGGSGKTRLAGEVAGRVAARFADGAWLAELTAVRDPAQVAAGVAVALGVREQPTMPVADALARALVGQQLLLVLDNCEHLIGAAAQLCAGLLAACDDVRVLATSREPLRLAGEARYRLAPLTVPDMDDLASAVRAEAVGLFADRARSADAHFTLTSDTAPAVARLVRRLDGMPLAIELAAARAEALGVAQLLDRLDDRFALLTGGDRLAPDRQRSLAATVGWSYQLLDEDQSRVFRLLSLFPGPFTLEAAEAVAGKRARPGVLHLVDCSLLNPPRPGPDGRARYGMLETLRAYGAERLAEAEEEDAAAAALAGWTLRVAEDAAAGLQITSGELAAARWLDAEDATIRQVLSWTLDHDAAVAMRLAVALAPWWHLRGRLAGQSPALRQAADRAVAGSDAWGALRFWLGKAAKDSGDLTRALGYYTTIVDDCGDSSSRLLADVLADRSVVLANLDRLTEAAEDGQRSLAMARAVGYPAAQALALERLTVAAICGDDLDSAMRLAWQADQVQGDVPGWIARLCSYNLTYMLNEAGDLAAAGRIGAAALAECRKVGDLDNQVRLLMQMALLDVEEDRTHDAAALLNEAFQVTARTGAGLEVPIGLDLCGHLCAATGRYAEAVTVWAAYAAVTRDLESVDLAIDARRRREPLRKARQALGTAQTRAAEDRGAAMSLATAVQYAHVLTSADPMPPDPKPGSNQLSSRERELVTLVAQGCTNAQIAAQLHISIRTVSSHLDRIRDKTGCRRRADLTRLALTAGLV